MGLFVCNGAQLSCSFGAAPSPMVVLPQSKVMTSTPAANIMDNKPLVNILPFGVCTSPANPATYGGTIKVPCVPVTAAPWVPGKPKVLIGGMPAIDNTCKLMCSYLGVIQVVSPGQVKSISG